ncbi:hypothetical protein [Serratia fonticola]|uniref:hypothetical protein n=1 Tax=Serratia fonticola TaxID=47917 RepID=UPI0021ADC677|nr:hypothetical protein [Serratia fonticola]
MSAGACGSGMCGMDHSCEKTIPETVHPALHTGNMGAKINGVILVSKTGKKTGQCRRDKCSNPISENPEANEMRICDAHFITYNKNKENRKSRYIAKVANSKIPSKTLSAMEVKYWGKNKHAPKTKNQISRIWYSTSRVRRSNVNHILKSREWLNTQSLLRNKKLHLYNSSLFDYVQDICLLYQLKFYCSRDFLNPNNKYKKHSAPFISTETPCIVLNLEVSFTFQTGRNINANDEDIINTSSKGIIIVPQKIRRMVTLRKAILRKTYMEARPLALRFPDKTKCMKKDKKDTCNENLGLYSRLRKENDPELEGKMNHLYKSLNPHHPPYQYKAFQRFHITEELPLFSLCQTEYSRVYSPSRVFFFFDVKDVFKDNPIFNELFALVSFYYLMSGEGTVVISRFLKWKDALSNWRPHIYKNASNLLRIFLLNIFSIDIKNKNEIVPLYNKFFSKDVIHLCISTNEIKSIISS